MGEARQLLKEVWALRSDGRKVYPYTGIRGPKKGMYSVNFSSRDNTKFQAISERDLIVHIQNGAFCQRGTIRMMSPEDGAQWKPNAFAPVYFCGKKIRDEFCA